MKLLRLFKNGLISAIKKIGVFFKWLFSGKEKVAIAGLFLTSILFIINYFQFKEIRNQDRNDFYSTHAGILNVELSKQVGFNPKDTGFVVCDYTVRNVSDYNCEIVWTYSEIVPEKNYFWSNYEFQDFEIKFMRQRSGFQSLLPDEHLNSTMRINTNNILNLKYATLRFFIVYKNSLGGFYHTYIDSEIEINHAMPFNEIISIPLGSQRKYFKSYTVEEFPELFPKPQKEIH